MIEIDILSQRYGRPPSDFLNMNAKDFQFNLLVGSIGIEAEIKQTKKAQASRKGRI